MRIRAAFPALTANAVAPLAHALPGEVVVRRERFVKRGRAAERRTGLNIIPRPAGRTWNIPVVRHQVALDVVKVNERRPVRLRARNAVSKSVVGIAEAVTAGDQAIEN